MLGRQYLAALIGAMGVGIVHAQTSTTPAVPTGTPVPGDYTGSLRPQVHFSPPVGFMNDPNGLFKDAAGLWHMYYQYNPTADVAGNQHWGHATSEDLYTWINQPIAIFPINESSFIYSGSAVIDVNDTSGFFPDQDNGVVAIYTVATYEPVVLQTQFIAYSRDGGYSFTPYEANPVIDVGSSQFRDPKVVWYEDHWAMVVSHAIDFVITVYTSPDLINWSFASNFSHYGYLGYQYECPNLVEVPYADKPGESTWLLQISINPKAPLGGSFSEYFLGDFDGYTFSPVDNVTRFTDFAKDAYAGQFFFNTPGEAVAMNWASNWEYTNAVPSGPREGWRSAMAVPRSVSIKSDYRTGIQEANSPYDMTPILGDVLVEQTVGNGSLAVDFASVYSNALWVEANVTGIPSANNTGSLNFTFTSPISGEYLRGGYFFDSQAFFQDRGGLRGFDNPFFTDKFSTAQLLNGTFSMQLLIDRSVLEIFLMEGLQSSTISFFPQESLTVLSMAVANVPTGQNTSIRVTGLKSTWQPLENEMGIVDGNVTMSNGSYTKRLHPRMAYEARF